MASVNVLDLVRLQFSSVGLPGYGTGETFLEVELPRAGRALRRVHFGRVEGCSKFERCC